MPLDAEKQVYTFDDRPEQERLKGWYDRVRKPEPQSELSKPEVKKGKDVAKDEETRRAS